MADDKSLPQFPSVQSDLRAGASADEREIGYRRLAESYADVCAKLCYELARCGDQYDELNGKLFAVDSSAREAREEARASRRELRQLRKELLGEAKKVAADVAEKVAEESGSHDVEAIVARARQASAHDLEDHVVKVVENIKVKTEHTRLTSDEEKRQAMRRQIIASVIVGIVMLVIGFVFAKLTK